MSSHTYSSPISPTESRPVYSGVLLAIVGTFLFALKSILIKFAFREGVNATTLLTFRMGLSLPFYLAMLWYLRRDEAKSGAAGTGNPIGQRLLLQCCSLGFLGYYLASFLDMSALGLISAQLERLTLFTYPTIIAVLAWMFLGEALNRRILASLAFCYLGLYLMVGLEKQYVAEQDVVYGVLLVMGAALSYSIYVVLAKPLMQQIGSRRFTAYAMIGSTIFVAIHFAATQPIQRLNQPLSVWGYGALLAFVCTVIPSFLINEAIIRLGATRTTVIGSVGPVITMLLAIGILGEHVSSSSICGMLLVVFGVSLVALRKKDEKTK